VYSVRIVAYERCIVLVLENKNALCRRANADTTLTTSRHKQTVPRTSQDIATLNFPFIGAAPFGSVDLG
jgi:hypothetical protein